MFRARLTSTAVSVLALAACAGPATTQDQESASDGLGAAPVTSEAVALDSTSSGDEGVAVPALDDFGRSNDPDPSSPVETVPATTETTSADQPTTSTTTGSDALDGPEEAIREISAQLDGQAGQPTDAELLDAVEPLQSKPTPNEVQSLRDGRHLNESGEENVFDEAANLACADVEVALTALDEGRVANAATRVGSASERAASSRVATIDDWHPILRDAADQIETEGPGDVAPLLAFLSTCTQGGYEL